MGASEGTAGDLSPAPFTWRLGQEFVRCHDSSYGATEFNARADISQRFRPFVIRGRTVPTLYGSESIGGALSETLFHAVPTDGSDRRVRLSRLSAWQISRLKPTRDLRLADLRDEALKDLPVTREELIESPASAYPWTADVAKDLFSSPLEPDGLIWNARQSRDDLAMVLFARGRVARADLEVARMPMAMAMGEGYEHVLSVGEEMGITITQ